MRKLTDVYIKVTERNVKQIREYYGLTNYNFQYPTYIQYHYDDVKSCFWTDSVLNNRKKVSLSQLKRLIDAIPTREEITRLKRQISAYKTNYERAVKHSLSKEDVIEELQRKLNRERSTITDLFKQRKEVQLNHCKQIRTLAQEVERVKNLYNDALNEIEVWKDNDKKSLELIKEMNDDNDILIDCMEKLDDKLELTERKLDIQADLIRDKNAQIEQLKQRKWWQIWNK